MRRQADAEGITSIAMPRIGVGYGGLSWKKVRAIVEAVFGDWPGTLVVYEEYVAGDSADTVAHAERTGRTSHDGDGSDPPSEPVSTQGDYGESDRGPERRWRADGRHPLLQRQREYGCFSNFSPHPIRLKGKTWPTSEHYFQAQKFAGTPDEEEVRQAKSPMIAARMGRSRKRPFRKDWESVKDSIMHEAVLAKFTPTRRPAGDPAGNWRLDDRRAHGERRLLGRRRRRQRQEPARPDPHAGAGGVAVDAHNCRSSAWRPNLMDSFAERLKSTFATLVRPLTLEGRSTGGEHFSCRGPSRLEAASRSPGVLPAGWQIRSVQPCPQRTPPTR